jgi:arylsulfatase A-like enzyme
MKKDLTRRGFVEKLGACTAGGAALSQLLNRRASAQSAASQGAAASDPCCAPQDAAAWTAPPKLTNPNILVVMVDQMRWPSWLTSSQMTTLQDTILPNIFGKLRNTSYVFHQYYTAATVCTAARGTLLTGLYAPQTAMYVGDGELPGIAPNLDPAFPTWGAALPALNAAYRGNLWWFGKWHLSNCKGSAPLAPYNFNTRTYPGGAAGNPSPNGAPSEGSDGGLFGKTVFASDGEIAGDFIAWLEGEAPTSSPWCATVSLINPHDITSAPGWTVPPVPPPGLPAKAVYFQPPSLPPAGMPALYSSHPHPWNYENLNVVKNKPSLQHQLLANNNSDVGPVTNWIEFLNQYFWFQGFADQQIGRVLAALDNSPYRDNTIVVFLADHGDYGGSHGLHDKGCAVYDESIHVPLYVHLPGQSVNIAMNQMCSSVDFFGLLCDFATTGGGLWRQAYPDLAARQSIWNFLYSNSLETRIAPSLGIPYVFHTCDRTIKHAPKFHIVGLRTKTNPSNTAQPGAKLAIYSEWAQCTTIPDGTPPDMEFYDYNPATGGNTSELGNDYFSKNQTTQNTIAEYADALGSWGPPATGLIAAELNAPLVGTGTDGKPLSQAHAAAQQAYITYASNGACKG